VLAWIRLRSDLRRAGGSAYNGLFWLATATTLLFVFNQFLHLSVAALRPRNVHAPRLGGTCLAGGARYRGTLTRRYFRGDAACRQSRRSTSSSRPRATATRSAADPTSCGKIGCLLSLPVGRRRVRCAGITSRQFPIRPHSWNHPSVVGQCRVGHGPASLIRASTQVVTGSLARPEPHRLPSKPPRTCEQYIQKARARQLTRLSCRSSPPTPSILQLWPLPSANFMRTLLCRRRERGH